MCAAPTLPGAPAPPAATTPDLLPPATPPRYGSQQSRPGLPAPTHAFAFPCESSPQDSHPPRPNCPGEPSKTLQAPGVEESPPAAHASRRGVLVERPPGRPTPSGSCSKGTVSCSLRLGGLLPPPLTARGSPGQQGRTRKVINKASPTAGLGGWEAERSSLAGHPSPTEQGSSAGNGDSAR